MAAKLHNYSSIADIQEFWMTEIAPKYFDFNDTNLYKIGNFGYQNEVMSAVTADVFNAINIAKREFYSSTAENLSTFYKLAGIFRVPIPMATPATCNIVLLIQEKEILANSTVKDGVYTFILDNTIEILADDIQFSLDYPIRINAKYLNGAYSYTTYYDTSVKNTISKLSSQYIQNKTMMIEGQRFLLMSLELNQYKATSESQVITKNGEIDTVSNIFSYEGDIAGFDVFYIEDPEVSVEKYIPCYTSSEITPAGAYCIYEFLPDNKIRITFPKNSYFTPKVNSEIRCIIYTSKGEDGNFDEYNADLTCRCNSEKYAYNNSVVVRGIVNGSSKNGKAMPSNEDFIREIREKNCTNNTITTASDLQIYFNSIIQDKSIRVEFSKKRDDTLRRIYSAFVLMKDDNDNVIPTNTCSLKMSKNDFDEYNSGRGVIRPGKVFEYLEGEDGTIVLSPISLSDSLDKYDTRAEQKFLFTNPFLIAVSVEEGIIGYYGNSISEIKSVDFTFVEDRSFYQFICLGLQIDRNPIIGESYYTFTAKISPSTKMDYTELISIPGVDEDDTTPEEELTIRAKHDGRIISTYFDTDRIVCKVEYSELAEDDPERFEIIQVSTYTEKLEDGTFIYHSGYSMQFNVLDTFVKGDILAKRKVTDHGKLRACLDIGGTFLGSKLYIPMTIEEYDVERDNYTLRGYVSTNDFISLNKTMVLDHGILNYNSEANNYISIPMENLDCIVNIFYKNDVINYRHEYSSFDYFANYTMTNKYTTKKDNPVALIKGLDFIRSTLTFIDQPISQPTNEDSDPEFNPETGKEEIPDSTYGNFRMKIGMMPIVKSNWIKYTSNFKYLINKVYKTYDFLYDAYFQLENQYGIEVLFFNTYGKSNRYMIGNNSGGLLELTSVNCSMYIGVELNAMSTSSIFIEKYRTYLKSAIESLNDLTNEGKSLYLLDLLAESKKEFPEIVHLEFYDFNEYGYGAQVITPKDVPSTTTAVQNYVPEFVNIYTVNQNGIEVPKIDIKLLNYTALS